MTDEDQVGRIHFAPGSGSKRVANDPADPWSINYFDPPKPHIPAPSPRVQTPKLPPDVDRLFSLQSDLVRAVNALAAMERTHGKDQDFLLAQRNVENAYRVINRYLKEFAAAGGTF